MDISQTGDISGDISCLKLALHADGVQRLISMIGDISNLPKTGIARWWCSEVNLHDWRYI